MPMISRSGAGVALVGIGVMFARVEAQTPARGPWWPNKQWGAGDAADGSNWITPDKALKAAALVGTGQIVELGHVYERGMPLKTLSLGGRNHVLHPRPFAGTPR